MLQLKRENFRMQTRNASLNTLFSQKRQISQNRTPDKQFGNTIPLTTNNNQIKERRNKSSELTIYQIIQNVTYGFIDSQTLKNQVEDLLKKNPKNKQQYKYLTFTSRIAKMQFKVFNKIQKKIFIYGRQFSDKINLIQINHRYFFDEIYTIKVISTDTQIHQNKIEQQQHFQQVVNNQPFHKSKQQGIQNTQTKVHQKQQSSNLLIDQNNYVKNLTYEELQQLIFAADERLNYIISNQQESQQQPSKQQQQKGEIKEVQSLGEQQFLQENQYIQCDEITIFKQPKEQKQVFQQSQDVSFSPQPQNQKESSLTCENCNSGPYKNLESYSSHIYSRHQGKTPDKNICSKSGNLQGTPQQQIHQQQQQQLQTNQIHFSQNKNNINSQHHQIAVVCWNISSLKPTTLQIIKENDPHIICLQETRQIINTSPRYNFIYKLRSEHSQGGGISIGIHKQFICRDISHFLKLDEIEYLLVQCTKNNVELYILNIYSANSKSFRNQQKKLQSFIVQLKIKKPNALIMIVGDANNSTVKLKGMIDLIPEYQITYQRFVKNKLRQSKTDIFQINQELSHSISFHENNLSDHTLIICQLNLKKNLKSKKQYNFIMNKEQVYLLNLNYSHSENFREFIQKIQENQKRFQIYRRKMQGLLEINELNFLKALISNQYYDNNGFKYSFRNGVPQGSILSPYLFDIYTDLFMAETKKINIDEKFDNYYFYADDLAIICSEHYAPEVIKGLELVAKQMSLVINTKKCAIMKLHQGKKKFQGKGDEWIFICENLQIPWS